MAPETSGQPGALRALALYAALVGLPALGLVAVVHAGRRLVAPPSMGGAWRVESVAPGDGAGACPALAAGTPLVVSQSGVHVTLAIGGGAGGLVVSARLDGDSLTGTVRGADACPALTGGRVAARVDRSSAPHRMAGRLVSAGGAGPSFQAARLPAARGSGAGH